MAKELVIIPAGMKICYNPAYSERHNIFLGTRKDKQLIIVEDYNTPTYENDWLYLEVVKSTHLPNVKKLAMTCKVYEDGARILSEIVIIYPEELDISQVFDYKPTQ